MKDKYIIKLTCWDYPNPTPYTDYVLNGKSPMKFETYDEAKIALLINVIEEANELNFSSDENGECVDRRHFIPDIDVEDYECIIRAWDGDDYMPVTAYDILTIKDELEYLNRKLQEKHGEDITVKICSYKEDDGSIKYYYTSAKYGESDSFNTPEAAYKAADAYLYNL